MSASVNENIPNCYLSIVPLKSYMIMVFNNLCGKRYFRGTAGGGGGGQKRLGGGGSGHSYLGGGCDHSVTMPILVMHLIGRYRS